MTNPFSDRVIRNISAKLPADYDVRRVVSVALCELQQQYAEHEGRLLNEYGRELLDVLERLDKKV